MYKGKVDCEARIYIYFKEDEPMKERNKRISTISTVISETVKVTNVKVLATGYDEKNKESYTELTVLAEVLVQYDPHITHLNDYRVKGCRELRKLFPNAGAIMAHSIDTYNTPRLKGFIRTKRQPYKKAKR
ncbi:hypothetical protein [Bacillus solitudinis]|uniref:hypothetical protein n=1 Tax=Bacillus solitudinis TaxID=2014074 RepID=UPI000C236604|nr:hypothetical protein [Bacillus solitudinis]